MIKILLLLWERFDDDGFLSFLYNDRDYNNNTINADNKVAHAYTYQPTTLYHPPGPLCGHNKR